MSNEIKYRRNEAEEHEPFCVVYFRNGAQQLLTLQEALQLVEAPLNYCKAILFKLLPPQTENTPTLIKYHSNKAKEEQWLH